MGHDCRRVHRSFLLGEKWVLSIYHPDLRLETDERLAAFPRRSAFQLHYSERAVSLWMPKPKTRVYFRD